MQLKKSYNPAHMLEKISKRLSRTRLPVRVGITYPIIFEIDTDAVTAGIAREMGFRTSGHTIVIPVEGPEDWQQAEAYARIIKKLTRSNHRLF